jgi:hypothetical protein
MLAALALSLTVTPIWVFGGNLVVLAMGALLMQSGVQGAWGVMPVHLNELASDSARGFDVRSGVSMRNLVCCSHKFHRIGSAISGRSRPSRSSRFSLCLFCYGRALSSMAVDLRISLQGMKME